MKRIFCSPFLKSFCSYFISRSRKRFVQIFYNMLIDITYEYSFESGYFTIVIFKKKDFLNSQCFTVAQKLQHWYLDALILTKIILQQGYSLYLYVIRFIPRVNSFNKKNIALYIWLYLNVQGTKTKIPRLHDFKL